MKRFTLHYLKAYLSKNRNIKLYFYRVKSNCSIYRKSAGLDEFDKLEILQSNLPYTTTSQNG